MNIVTSGEGGSTYFGGGGVATASALSSAFAPGQPGTSYGGGGSGGSSTVNSPGQTGGAGYQGIVIITEYIG
jgi:hypothetical protein